jgi:hypothetical protein
MRASARRPLPAPRGSPASAYAKARLEPEDIIGAPGEPAFEHGCGNIGSGLNPGGFYKDSFGVVHLHGFIVGCTDEQTAFTLPPGFRPTGGNREHRIRPDQGRPRRCREDLRRRNPDLHGCRLPDHVERIQGAAVFGRRAPRLIPGDLALVVFDKPRRRPGVHEFHLSLG